MPPGLPHAPGGGPGGARVVGGAGECGDAGAEDETDAPPQYRWNQRWLREVLLSGTLQETLDAAYPKWPAGSVISMPAS